MMLELCCVTKHNILSTQNQLFPNAINFFQISFHEHELLRCLITKQTYELHQQRYKQDPGTVE